MKYFFGIKDKPNSILPNYFDAVKDNNSYQIQIGDNIFQALKINEADNNITFDFFQNMQLKFVIVFEKDNYARLKFENIER